MPDTILGREDLEDTPANINVVLTSRAAQQTQHGAAPVQPSQQPNIFIRTAPEFDPSSRALSIIDNEYENLIVIIIMSHDSCVTYHQIGFSIHISQCFPVFIFASLSVSDTMGWRLGLYKYDFFLIFIILHGLINRTTET